jgi:hypothetical protein
MSFLLGFSQFSNKPHWLGGMTRMIPDQFVKSNICVSAGHVLQVRQASRRENPIDAPRA